MPRPEKHVFVCSQARPPGHPRSSSSPCSPASFNASTIQRDRAERDRRGADSAAVPPQSERFPDAQLGRASPREHAQRRCAPARRGAGRRGDCKLNRVLAPERKAPVLCFAMQQPSSAEAIDRNGAMNKILKYLLLTAGGIALILIALAAYIAATFNPNDYSRRSRRSRRKSSIARSGSTATSSSRSILRSAPTWAASRFRSAAAQRNSPQSTRRASHCS